MIPPIMPRPTAKPCAIQGCTNPGARTHQPDAYSIMTVCNEHWEKILGRRRADWAASTHSVEKDLVELHEKHRFPEASERESIMLDVLELLIKHGYACEECRRPNLNCTCPEPCYDYDCDNEEHEHDELT